MSLAPATLANTLARDTVAVIMAGGEGHRLRELTRFHSKPALPFAGHYRNIDFSLSNCVNSGVRRIGVLTQYKAHSLIQHLQNGWSFLRPQLGEFVELWPAQHRTNKCWYRGTADAVRQNIDILSDYDARYVLVLAGDHIYRMDYAPMVSAHIDSAADVTIGCVDVPVSAASGFGLLRTDCSGRLVEFVEKPAQAPWQPRADGTVLASMGIYVFSYEALADALLGARPGGAGSCHDFGHDVLPEMIESARVQAHEFRDARSRAPGYWRDVGTLESYWNANMDFLEDPAPIDLCDASWPIFTSRHQCAPARVAPGGSVTNSIVAGGSRVCGDVDHSIVFENVRVGLDARIRDSLILPGAVIGQGCTIEGAIVDGDCRVPEGAIIGEPRRARDRARRAAGEITLVTTGTVTDPENSQAAALDVA